MKELKEMILRVGTMMMPLGFMVSLVDYPVYAGITFLIGFISLLELIGVKKNKKTQIIMRPNYYSKMFCIRDYLISRYLFTFEKTTYLINHNLFEEFTN